VGSGPPRGASPRRGTAAPPPEPPRCGAAAPERSAPLPALPPRRVPGVPRVGGGGSGGSFRRSRPGSAARGSQGFGRQPPPCPAAPPGSLERGDFPAGRMLVRAVPG
ncbi:unnamed protein product, partial [Coccothraustes coccothraustes]